MTEEKQQLPNNMLSADELLRNKGIKGAAWDEFERTVKVLPKTGKKQFEPNDSWLQNMQIEKGLKNRKDLIGIERVERISQLATAEWLPAQKRACVRKNSGQDWANFGLEKNGCLYLIPEEALFLLEANSLELTWNDMPLSIQQAYELLIDNVECSMEEYRVYSQLVRYGYRIQRFIYEQSERNMRNDATAIKRKVIVDPENGLRMADSQQNQNSRSNRSKKSSTDDSEMPVTDISGSNVEVCQHVTPKMHQVTEEELHDLMKDLLSAVENLETQCTSEECKSNAESTKNANGRSPRENGSAEKMKRNPNIEIISDEMLLGSIRIFREPTDNSVQNHGTKRWQGSRIQRNVKLLPKRTDKPTPIDIPPTDSHCGIQEQNLDKRKISDSEETEAKKPRHEVIELSDDEIQELPRPMSRTELLNMIPNIASQVTTTVNISRGYIPHNVKPQKSIYHYTNVKFRNLQEADKRLRSNSRPSSSNTRQNTSHHSNVTGNEVVRRNANIPAVSQNLSGNVYDMFMREFYPIDNGGQYTNYSPPFMYNNRIPFPFYHNAYWHNRNAMVQRNVFQNVFIALENHDNAIHQNRFLSIQMNNFTLPNINSNMPRPPFIRNHIRHSFHQNFSPQRRFYQHRVVENMSINCNVGRSLSLPEPRQRFTSRESSRGSHRSHNDKYMYQSSFKVLPGASTWTELKSKWREEKTITIDDEDGESREESADCSEVHVLEKFNSSLVGPRNVKNLAEVFERLRIIKSAPEKTVRRNKSPHKISYNVYSSTQHYRKATPGTPMYRVVVIKQKGDNFLQPIEIHRLQQDAKNAPVVLACVSMSISYIQPGFISVPDLT